MVQSNAMATVRIVTGGMSHGKVRYQMKIVIDISEDVYTRLFDNGIQDNEIAVDDVCEMAMAIRKGTPLMITRGNCMLCGKELTEGLFFCKECEDKSNSGK